MADEYDDDFETVDEEDTVTNNPSSSKPLSSSSTTVVQLPSGKSSVSTATNSRNNNNDVLVQNSESTVRTVSASQVSVNPVSTPPVGRVKSSSLPTTISPTLLNSSVIMVRQQTLQRGIREGIFLHNSVQTMIDNHHQGVQCDTTEYVSLGIQIPDDLGVPNARVGTINPALSAPSSSSSSSSSSATPSKNKSTASAKERTGTKASVSSSTGTGTGSASTGTGTLSSAELYGDNNKERLLKILDCSGKVMETLLEDNLLCFYNDKYVSSSQSVSDHHSTYHSSVKMIPSIITDILPPKIPLLAGRTITAVSSSYNNNYDIAVAFSSMNTEIIIPILFRSGISFLPQYREASIICLLSSIDNSLRKVFVCWPNSLLTSVSFSNVSDSNVLIAGSSSGSLYAWNMDDPVWLHSTIYGTGITVPPSNTPNNNNNNIVTSTKSSSSINLSIDTGLRSPSFSVYNNEKVSQENTFSNGGSIVRIVPLDKNVSLSSSSSSLSLSSVSLSQKCSHFRVGMGLKSFLDDTANIPNVTANNSSTTSTKQNSYQFAVIYDNGTINIWIVYRLPLPNNNTTGSISTSVNNDSKVSNNSMQNTNSSNIPSASTLIALIDERDYGRGVTGTLRMIKSSTITPEAINQFTSSKTVPLSTQSTLSSVSSLVCMDSDTDSSASKFLIALQNGYIVLTGYNSTEKLSPKIFFPPSLFDDNLSGLQYQRLQNSIPVGDGPLLSTPANNPYPSTGIRATCVRFHPHPRLTDIFIAGFSNGLIGLYSLQYALPLSVWSIPPLPNSSQNMNDSNSGSFMDSNTIIHLSWLTYRPSVFVAVNSNGQLAVWDLTINIVKPVTNSTVPVINGSIHSNRNNTGNGFDKDNNALLGNDRTQRTCISCNGGTLHNPSQFSVLCTTTNSETFNGTGNDPYFFSKVQAVSLPSSFTLPVLRSDTEDNGRNEDSVERMLSILEGLR